MPHADNIANIFGIPQISVKEIVVYEQNLLNRHVWGIIGID